MGKPTVKVAEIVNLSGQRRANYISDSSACRVAKATQIVKGKLNFKELKWVKVSKLSPCDGAIIVISREDLQIS